MQEEGQNIRLLEPVRGVQKNLGFTFPLESTECELYALLSCVLGMINTQTGASLWNSSSPAYSDDERWPTAGSWPVSQPALLISPSLLS